MPPPSTGRQEQVGVLPSHPKSPAPGGSSGGLQGWTLGRFCGGMALSIWEELSASAEFIPPEHHTALQQLLAGRGLPPLTVLGI